MKRDRWGTLKTRRQEGHRLAGCCRGDQKIRRHPKTTNLGQGENAQFSIVAKKLEKKAEKRYAAILVLEKQ